MGFRNFIREYFTFNRRERNGVFILLSVILFLILYLSLSDHFYTVEKTDFSRFDKDIAQFEEQLNRNSDSVSTVTKNYFTSSPKGVPRTNSVGTDSAERFFFDPNNLPEDDWKRMGLSAKQIKVIKNYESKGGRFRSKEDVKKMYCITPEEYASIEPFIKIPTDTLRSYNNGKVKFEKEKILIELNSADTIQLDKLKGIGITFAKRIIKYRDLLGGFVSKEQLLEVYGLNKDRYDAFSSSVFTDDSKVRKINVNSALIEELRKHPYIKYNLANLILNYRNLHGNYKAVEDIKQLDLMNDGLFTKIAPYLTVQ